MTDATDSPAPAEDTAGPPEAQPLQFVAGIYHHMPHPRLVRRHERGPTKTSDAHPTGINGRIAVLLTKGVGTMTCAYVFALLAILGFPGLTVSLSSLSFTTSGITAQQYVQWISQTFIQLVMLAVIMVGQNIIGAAADLRSVQTYDDAEAILHECLELQAHLSAQDAVMEKALQKVSALELPRASESA